ncbi:MAG TPA: hypothetical protein VML75_14920 [Kofleriaceae bacterium]|nr:hypothetical protein [Kofleriaceae bacterium]
MRFARLSTLLVAASLMGAPATVAFAQPAATAQLAPASAPSAAPPTEPASDAERYADREAMNQSVADFQGGNTVVIGGSTLGLVLLIVLLVILL